MRRLGRGIERLLRGLGIADDVARVEAIDAWHSVAVAVLGSDATETKAVAIEGQALVVAVPDAAWAAEIRLREGELVAGLRRRAPGARIGRVRTVPARQARASQAP